MRVFVHIKDEDVCVECGMGRNKVSWLCNSALHRYDKNNWLDSGNWSSVEDDKGVKISPDAAIADKIDDNSRIFLKFEEIKIEEEKAPPKPSAAPAPAAKKK